jgi:hypothetical protein
MDTPILPVGETPVLAMPGVCSGCHRCLTFEEEKVCVPGVNRYPWQSTPTRVYHPRCAPPE